MHSARIAFPATLAAVTLSLAIASQAQNQNRPPEAATGVPPLKLIVFDDKSGEIGLPEGWKITSSSNGAVITTGPNDEAVIVNRIIAIYESEQQKSKSLGRQQAFICPYSEDVLASFTCFVKQNREAAHLPPATINVVSTQPISPEKPLWKAAATIVADFDFQDGKGSRSAILRIAISPKPKAPLNFWLLSYTMLTAPKDIAEQQMPTLKAIEASYKFISHDHPQLDEYDKYSGRQEDGDARRAALAKQAAAAVENQKSDPAPGSMEKAGTHPVAGP